MVGDGLLAGEHGGRREDVSTPPGSAALAAFLEQQGQRLPTWCHRYKQQSGDCLSCREAIILHLEVLFGLPDKLTLSATSSVASPPYSNVSVVLLCAVSSRSARLAAYTLVGGSIAASRRSALPG